ncbi:oligopeptide transport system, permease protein appC related protein [Thermoplasma acidophilum]|uniref:Oligopeptide transport system, permease protein appC related protein n=1 Tax=Thermoplasma acidophilum (strain ATCC 25905 / DSM 1728 / JCM 9062 / NBRC 15155 / AMRC-C165) TaxID=273075 RepID=Q9HIL2_THEAC|nr:ABC transporter permease [Thermoplasma acidophilum]CAC12448.1 oligopeptide transport system, permease protein appC related protein [Thermoplasma acidophilum]
MEDKNFVRNRTKNNLLGRLTGRIISFENSMGIVLKNSKSKAGFILLVSIVIFSIIGIFYRPYNPEAYLFAKALPPNSVNILGTTGYGQDVFSQLIAGAAPTLMIAFSVGIAGTLISVFVGLLAGFSSPAVNGAINAIISIFLVVPGVLLIMLFGTYFLGIHQSLGYLPTIIILVITGWAFGARTFRSITLSIAKRDYILSSLLIGESRLSIIFRQIMRAIMPVVVSNFFFTSMYGAMGLTFVEYLGVGNIEQVNWGTMLYWAINNEAYLTGQWWWILPPSIMISLLMFSFILLNFGLDEMANPSLRVYQKKRRAVKND